MSEKTTDQLRDELTTHAMATAEHQREAARLRAMLDEKTTQLVQATIDRDEARRELAQVLGSERAVRRLVVLAGIDGQPYLAVADLRHALDTGETP